MVQSKQGHVALNCEGAASINFQKYIIFGTLPEYLTVDRAKKRQKQQNRCFPKSAKKHRKEPARTKKYK